LPHNCPHNLRSDRRAIVKIANQPGIRTILKWMLVESIFEMAVVSFVGII
jgi:hypothetical protein